jgi:hypothetical protein
MRDRRDDDDVREDEEASLRDAFASLREDDAASAPPFEAVVAAAQAHAKAPADRRRASPVPSLVWPLATAALVAAVITVVRRPERPLPSLASIERWTAPTDFLLETPGREFLGSVPRFGVPPAFGPLVTDGSGPRPRTKKESP